MPLGFQYVTRNGGGAEGTRTPDPLIANEVLSQLSYSPVPLRARSHEARTMLSTHGEVKRADFVQVADRIGPR
jgi:hypothetical protein